MINKTTTYPTITTIKFFIIAIAALAAAMSLAAASQKIKRKKKQAAYLEFRILSGTEQQDHLDSPELDARKPPSV